MGKAIISCYTFFSNIEVIFLRTYVRKNKLMIVTSLFLLVIVVSITYAYFVAQGGATSSGSVRVQTSTTDNLSFSVGSSIALTADQTSFASGKGNVTGSTTATAVLTANNATNKATEHYYLYFNITNNPFIYTTSSNSAELLLTITDPNNKVVTELDGMNYVTSGGVSGFDITTYTGPIKIADYYEISASPSKTDTWKVQVTLVNLNSDQTSNAGKSFSGVLQIGKDVQYTIASSGCTAGSKLATCLTTLSTKYGQAASLYHHDSNLTLGAEDDSYRYSGPNPDNYVCFGSTASPCPEDNLYRIIYIKGGQVKLIKATVASSTLLGTDGDYSSSTSYRWNYKADTTINDGYGSNDWSTSLLNKTNLNTNFINKIGTNWSSKIATTVWQVGGAGWDMVLTAGIKNMYSKEMTTNASTTYSAKIGLMYASDYGFAASPKYWSLPGYNSSGEDIRKGIKENWLYNGGSYEWTISRYSSFASSVFNVTTSGYVYYDTALNTNVVRPSFNLVASTTYASGTGTKIDPIRIVI